MTYMTPAPAQCPLALAALFHARGTLQCVLHISVFVVVPSSVNPLPVRNVELAQTSRKHVPLSTSSMLPCVMNPSTMRVGNTDIRQLARLPLRC